MDGGRVLRALLAYRFPYGKATQAAATIGQGMAILFGLSGALIGNWILLFIALFVYLAAGEEMTAVHFRTLAKGIVVRDAMRRTFCALDVNDLVDYAAKLLHQGYFEDFPVVRAGRVVGILFRSDVIKAIRLQELDLCVGELMHAGCPVLSEDSPLSDAIVRMRQCGCPSAAVVCGDTLVGVLSYSRLGEWLTIQTELGQRQPTSTGRPRQRAHVASRGGAP
jgi:CBS domain-containing protein